MLNFKVIGTTCTVDTRVYIYIIILKCLVFLPISLVFQNSQHLSIIIDEMAVIFYFQISLCHTNLGYFFFNNTITTNHSQNKITRHSHFFEHKKLLWAIKASKVYNQRIHLNIKLHNSRQVVYQCYWLNIYIVQYTV